MVNLRQQLSLLTHALLILVALVGVTAAAPVEATPEFDVAAAVDTVPAPTAAQLDSLRRGMVMTRGFLRSAVTRATHDIERLDRLRGALPDTVAAAPTVQDWRSGTWSLLAGGYTGVLDLDASTVEVDGVTAAVTWETAGDTLRVRPAVPGYEGGLLEVTHAEGRLIGTVSWSGETRPAAGERASLAVVRTVQPADAAGCTMAQYTDGSWGVAPASAACHQALDRYAGRLTYVARAYVAARP